MEDLVDFDKDSVKQMADNLRRGTPNQVFGARSQKRLLVLCDLVRFYQTISRDLTAANIRWNHVVKNFEEQWKALRDRKDADEPEVPKISKTLPVMKWTESFPDFLRQRAPVTLTALVDGEITEAVVDVAPDYIAVGTNDDFVRVPFGQAGAVG